MRDILTKIVDNPKLEAQWLSTLSLLEHIGARKIGKTVARSHQSVSVMEHFADETRHAEAFGKLSRFLAENRDCVALCREEAISYFQTLDRKASDWITKIVGHEEEMHNYWLVTALIERRAMLLYPLYRSLTRSTDVREELARVIEEESSHRKIIEKNALDLLKRYGVDNFDEASRLEEKLFWGFCDQLRREIQKAA